MDLADIRAGMLFSDVHALVVQKTTGVSKTGSPYADITLRAGSSTVKCKKWTYNAEKYDHIAVAGKVVKVGGKASMYQGELQGTIDLLEPSDKDPNDFAKRSRFNSVQLFEKILEVIEGFTDPLPKYVAKTLLTKYKEEFCKSPAARNIHHSWFGGLVEHTFSMLALGSRITRFYTDQYGALINRDRLLFGIILHDFGKIFEYDSSTPVFKHTPEGVLVNHIVTGTILVHNLATEWYNQKIESGEVMDEYPRARFERDRDILVHMIASHHGKLEWGSPVVPSCLEAVLLHSIDKIDADFMHVLDLLESGKDGEIEGFTERSRTDKAQYLTFQKANI